MVTSSPWSQEDIPASASASAAADTRVHAETIDIRASRLVPGVDAVTSAPPRLVRRQVIAAVVAVPMILLAVAGVALGRISRAEREASGQRDELRVTTEQLHAQAARVEASDRETLIPPLAHQGGVSSAAFSPDGRRVVTASADQTARIWDATTGKPLGPPLAHQGVVSSAAFSSDGRRVVTASDDQTARVWDAATGKPLASPLVHRRVVRSAAFSPDGRRVVTASADQTARVWDATTGKPLGPPLTHQGAWRAPRSAPTAAASSPRAPTRRRGSGTPRPASRSARPSHMKEWC
jgi:dipeptidyl aminopeptidase/acylaminoacyl peptidase